MKSLLFFALGAMGVAGARLDRRRFRDLDNPDLPVMKQPSARDQFYWINGKSAWVFEVLAGVSFLVGIIALFE